MYYVMRSHSHTDRQQLWKVMSRPIKDEETARAWMDYVESMETNPKHKFFLIQKEEVLNAGESSS